MCVVCCVSSDEGGVGGGGGVYFPATRLFEYRWPPEQERAELYFLQEQVAEFLRIRGIQRKYPGEMMIHVCVDSVYFFLCVQLP